ncbi:HMG-box [Martensiomyces pterosporus]|nr:HMG-box [Martensiomyces pterosporus]
MSSLVGSSSSRRRSSRSDPRSPYARPSTDPQSPQSPKSPASPQSPKRTYRRHPKKDPNAPEKWRSAYQLFRDDVNRELHGQEIPFSEMSKIHSRKWAELDEEKKEVYFERSRSDKAEYQRKMAIYEQTPEYRQYEEYLEKFYKQDSTVKRVGRPKGTRTSKSKGKSADVGRSQEQEHDLDPSTTKSQESPSSSQEISSR